MKVRDCIFFRLGNASKKAARFWKEQVAQYGVTGVQAMVLSFLLEKDQVTSIDLSQRTLLDSATLTGVLDRLEAEGFIARQAHEGDRRAISVCLTEKGNEIARAIGDTIDTANEDYLQNLTADEALILNNLLTKI